MDKEGLVDPETCIRCCQGLVAIDSESKVIRLVHYTAQEFFDRNRSLYFPEANVDMTEACLTYLMFEVFKQGPTDYVSPRHLGMAALSFKGPVSESRFLSSRQQRHPLQQYIAQHWGAHARGKVESILQDKILAFLQTPQALASAVQAQYAYTYTHHHRTLSWNEPLPLHVAISFDLELICQLLLHRISLCWSEGR